MNGNKNTYELNKNYEERRNTATTDNTHNVHVRHIYNLTSKIYTSQSIGNDRNKTHVTKCIHILGSKFYLNNHRTEGFKK